MSAKSSVGQGKKWLREASMRRLSQFVKNKTEMIGNAAQLGVGVIHTEKLEKSGLSAAEIYHLEQWVSGVETGRQCMLAILDCRLVQKLESEHIDKGAVMTNKDDFKPVELIRSLLHLPEEFLCDGGYIYETVFQRPPTGVVREALQMLVRTAMEKSPSQLGIEQINLAIKQLRLNNLGDLSESLEEDGENDNEICNLPPASSSSSPRGTPAEEAFRLQIMIELVRIHIVSTNRNQNKLPQPTSDSSFIESTPVHVASAAGFSSDSLPERLAMDVIELHLRTPLKVAFEQAGTMSAEELEGTNLLLKPYLKQLSALKAALAAELKDLQDSRAFLALGLSSEATDEAIKKAYRSLAIRLHPDKPGGDTARFQQLQDSYQEIIRKRKADSAERAAMEEVRSKYRPKSSTAAKVPPENSNATQDEEEAEIETEKGVGKKKKRNGSNAEGADTDKDEEMASEEKVSEEDEEQDYYDEDGELIVKPESTVGEGQAREQKGEEDDEKLPQNEASDDDSEEKEGNVDDDEEEEEEFDVEAVMRGLDGSEDVDEVFRRLAEHSKSRTYSSTRTDIGVDETGGGGEGGVGVSAPAPVHYENETEHAQAIVKQVGDLLQRIKKAAAECTQLAQLNIKWQKMFAKAMEPPCVLKDVLKLFTASSGAKCVRKVNPADPNTKPMSNMDACALQQAIMPVELICDWAQQVSALAMELPNACGIRYAAAASGNRAFLTAVERSMHLSLGALKTVLGLINTQEQLASCVRRVKDSQKLAAENPEIQELLMEMVRTGIKSNVVTITGAVDRIVETAMAASEVRDQVMQLMKEVERQERAEVKLRAAEAESRQTEEDYCEEDREALRKCREDRRNEDRNMRRGQEAEKEKEREEENKHGDGSLDDLKDKIRLLQVQLKVQHIQALQSMNSEVVGLQTQIISELKGLPFVTSMDSLFTENCSSLLKPRTVASEAKPSADAYGSDGIPESKDFKTSLLTLVAELVDSACHAIRSDLLHNATVSHIASAAAAGVTAAAGGVTAAAESVAVAVDMKQKSPRELVDKHLGWMRIMLADGSSYPRSQLDAVVAALAEQSQLSSASVPSDSVNATGDVEETPAASASSSSDSSGNNKATEPSATEVNMRLALLPDYRAKTLYLASLVDLCAVQDIIGPQLLQRLEEILLEGRQCISRSNVVNNTEEDDSVATGAGAAGIEGQQESSAFTAEVEVDVSVVGNVVDPNIAAAARAKNVDLNDIDDDADGDDSHVDLGVDHKQQEERKVQVNIRVDLPTPPSDHLLPPRPPSPPKPSSRTTQSQPQSPAASATAGYRAGRHSAGSSESGDSCKGLNSCASSATASASSDSSVEGENRKPNIPQTVQA